MILSRCLHSATTSQVTVAALTKGEIPVETQHRTIKYLGKAEHHVLVECLSLCIL